MPWTYQIRVISIVAEIGDTTKETGKRAEEKYQAELVEIEPRERRMIWWR